MRSSCSLEVNLEISAPIKLKTECSCSASRYVPRELKAFRLLLKTKFALEVEMDKLYSSTLIRISAKVCCRLSYLDLSRA